MNLTREQLDLAVGRALFNTSNWGDLGPRVLGRDTSAIRRAVVDAVLFAQYETVE